MTYIENVFLCMASPLLIAALCMGKRAEKILSVLPCRNGCLSAVCLHQLPFFAALYRADYLYHYYRDRPGGGGSDETSAIALLSADI